MAETLAVSSEAVAYLGEHCAIDMADHWQADAAFFKLLRYREVMLAILAETGGEAVASANAAEKGATIKGLIAAHLTGANERPICERWVPMVAAARRAKWMVEDQQVKPDACAESEDGAPTRAELPHWKAVTVPQNEPLNAPSTA